MKLGFLGVTLALVAAFGVFLSGTTHVSAQVPPQNATNCVSGNIGGIPPVSGFTCQFSTITTVAPGGTLVLTVNSGVISGVSINAFSLTNGAAGSCGTPNFPFGPAVIPGAGSASVTIFCPGGLGVGSTVTVSLSGFFTGSTVFTNSGFGPATTLTVTYNANGPSAATPVIGTCAAAATTCTVFTTAPINAGSFNFAFPAASSITAVTATPTAVAPVAVVAAPAAGCNIGPIPSVAATAVTLTLTCAPGVVLPAGETFAFTVAPVLAAAGTVTFVPSALSIIPAPTTQVVNLIFPLIAQPFTASVACGSGGPTSAGGNIALPILGSAALNCVITPKTAAGGSPVADGTFTVTIQNGSNLGILSCGTSGGCTVANNGQTVNLPCGNTAPNGTTPSVSCTSANFNVASVFSSLLASPASGLSLSGLANGGTITVQITFTATPGNGGTVGGINLGNFTFTLGTLGTGVLLVNASPALIPSNGTEASVVTATFATGSQNPFGAFLSGGAFLPGTFNFSAENVIFDNGRSSETVPCGISGANQGFGVNTANGFGTFNNVAPVLFSCQGAAVLAIGAGEAGDAPINVTYQSSVGGFQAIGSTLITVVSSGSPKIALSCSPTTITNTSGAGSSSTCIASVTDLNGIPLSGITGSNVTFTVSDPSRAIVTSCQLAVSAANGIGTTSTCATGTAQIPVSGTTFLSGQAAAVVTAVPNAAPGAVTVTATLGAFTPPAFACLLGQTSAAVVGGQTNCGTVSAIGGSGLALSLSQNALGFGGLVTLPNATSASQTITIGTPSTATVTVTGSPLSLTTGCNQVVVSTAAGTAVSRVVSAVSPSSAVVSIWRFNNATKTFQSGFFSAAGAPTDFSTTGGGSEVYFVCVSGAATITSA